ncbi:MAG: DUF4336 domain-containing protein, partial [Cyanobium sp. CZS 25K]|nr:DUF4336 domain-containing protein [Cyanobium sp. CZS25K]
ALVAIPPEPPPVFDLDPTPLLFHGRERGDEPLVDDPERRRKGWWRLVLFANYLRPRPLEVPPLAQVLRHCLAPGCRGARAHFGFYPFHWLPGWQEDFQALVPGGRSTLQVAAVLERLVFPRQRSALVAWIRRLAALKGLRWVVPAHYDAPVASSAEELTSLADRIEQADWAPDEGTWQTLAGIDRALVGLGLVPGEEPRQEKPQP